MWPPLSAISVGKSGCHGNVHKVLLIVLMDFSFLLKLEKQGGKLIYLFTYTLFCRLLELR